MADKEGITIYMQGLFAEASGSAMQQNQKPAEVSQQQQVSTVPLLVSGQAQKDTEAISETEATSAPINMNIREIQMAAACRQISMTGFEPISGVFDAGVQW